MKYSWEFKLECVEKYKKGKGIKSELFSNNDEKRKRIWEWCKIYELYGIDGLKHKQFNRNWTAEERFELVSQVLAGKSITSTAIDAGINNGQLYQWVIKYKQFGYDGLELRKGRKPKDNDMANKKKEELTISEKEELKILRRRNEYLEAENAYLKKLRALIVQKKAESSVKAKKQELSKNSEKEDIEQ